MSNDIVYAYCIYSGVPITRQEYDDYWDASHHNRECPTLEVGRENAGKKICNCEDSYNDKNIAALLKSRNAIEEKHKKIAKLKYKLNTIRETYYQLYALKNCALIRFQESLKILGVHKFPKIQEMVLATGYGYNYHFSPNLFPVPKNLKNLGTISELISADKKSKMKQKTAKKILLQELKITDDEIAEQNQMPSFKNENYSEDDNYIEDEDFTENDN